MDKPILIMSENQKCVICNEVTETFEMLNNVQVSESLKLGDYICSGCYYALPKKIYVTERLTGEQSWINESDYNNEVYEDLPIR